ncbi:hypothetical protein BU14_0055s0018 [Porphyra umbilicalis]|uniref:Uncharacterized protein n=1 Tax=Porphyra umbilicalis TaxID=2786 RepID=A0A1X6PHL7_PORUM|nr:hypothetical protein BU14_0055s0018 [Porphyra umbilicalis]|eukprot:OSX80295.1 hypothetical protein BU14_0055s0018 [Porphyra umbilicalis]
MRLGVPVGARPSPPSATTTGGRRCAVAAHPDRPGAGHGRSRAVHGRGAASFLRRQHAVSVGGDEWTILGSRQRPAIGGSYAARSARPGHWSPPPGRWSPAWRLVPLRRRYWHQRRQRRWSLPQPPAGRLASHRGRDDHHLQLQRPRGVYAYRPPPSPQPCRNGQQAPVPQKYPLRVGGGGRCLPTLAGRGRRRGVARGRRRRRRMERDARAAR